MLSLEQWCANETISISPHNVWAFLISTVTMMWRNVSFVHNIELQFTGNVVTQALDLGDVDNDGVKWSLLNFETLTYTS